MPKLVLPAAFLTLSTIILFGNFGLAIAAALLLWGLILAIVGRRAIVSIQEMEVGVVYNRTDHAFARFLPPGRHWLIPFAEQVGAVISTASQTANGRCLGVQSSGGIVLDVEWSLSFNLNPFKIPAATRAKAARSLPGKAAAMAVKHVNNCLRHVIGEYTIDQLCRPGVQKRLERQVRQLAAERLANLGFELSRVMIGAIQMPPHVKATLEEAHQRALQAENEAMALARLQTVVSHFSDADMARLMELERIHVLGQIGVTLLYATAVPAAREEASSAINSYTRFAAKRDVVTPGVS